MRTLILVTTISLAWTVQVLAEDVVNGQALFRLSCAACHGLGAAGDGPMAGVLVVKPRNLTRLAADNGGAFPAERIAARIDGRDPLVSNGSPMPVYGYFFEGPGATLEGSDGPVRTTQPVADIIAWLRTVQE